MLGSFWRGFEQLRGGGVVGENPPQGPSRVESENGSNVVVQQPEGTTSRVDLAWAPGASSNIMSDGVGSGQGELPASRPMSPLEATVLSPASSTAMPMLGNQDGGVEPFMSRTPGRGEQAMQTEGCLMHLVVLQMPSPLLIQQGRIQGRCPCWVILLVGQGILPITWDCQGSRIYGVQGPAPHLCTVVQWGDPFPVSCLG